MPGDHMPYPPTLVATKHVIYTTRTKPSKTDHAHAQAISCDPLALCNSVEFQSNFNFQVSLV